MLRTTLMGAFAALLLAVGGPAFAQYTPAAARNEITEKASVQYRDDQGQVRYREVERKVASDGYGNAQGNQYDLAVDGAFEGQTIAVIQLYPFDFETPRKALKEKGFSVYRWNNTPPSPEELAKALEKSCQLWIISGDRQLLNAKHLAVIKKFFDSGKGVYIWGDNEPYYADANYVAKALLGTEMLGNLPGDVTVGLQKEPGHKGLLRRHLLSTGLEYLYEGITIATIQPNQELTPLLYGSADNLVSAFYDKNGKRAILDGGFTRLYYKWDTAGTGRYVKNAAAWLANYERFGDAVVGMKVAQEKPGPVPK